MNIFVCESNNAYIILLHVFMLKTPRIAGLEKTIPNRLTKRAAAPAGLIPVQLVLQHAARAKATNKQPRSMKNLSISKRKHVGMVTFAKVPVFLFHIVYSQSDLLSFLVGQPASSTSTTTLAKNVPTCSRLSSTLLGNTGKRENHRQHWQQQ